ncbi:hypothetical protein [Amycolatopsis sp. cmx-4-61]|uniref:hypothetical protein n=1 Tax=Amycolatopsis sp. cmx-4-61 TaxID=2790937 RepID=UPI00397A0C8A
MTANERFKRRARKYANDNGISPAAATRILREQYAARQDIADQSPTPPDSTSLDQLLSAADQNEGTARPAGHQRGGEDKTSTTIDFTALAHVIDTTKGTAPKTDPKVLLGAALAARTRRDNQIEVDVNAAIERGERLLAQRSIMAYWVTWLVQAADTDIPQDVASWLYEHHGRSLSKAQQSALTTLLADPHLRNEDVVTVVNDDEITELFVSGLVSLLDDMVGSAPTEHSANRGSPSAAGNSDSPSALQHSNEDTWPLFQVAPSLSSGTTTWEALQAKMGPTTHQAQFKNALKRSLHDLTDLFDAHRRREMAPPPEWLSRGSTLPIPPEESAN